MLHRTLTARASALFTVLAVAVVPIVTVGAVPSSAAKVYDGPDVASYQHPRPTAKHPWGQPINWNKVARSGKEFAIVKASEGTNYVNPSFAGPHYHDYADAAAAGLVHGAYHFARPGFPIVSSANAQAKLFADVVGPVRTKKTLPPALDLEVNGGLNPPQLVAWAQAFLLKLRDLTGRTPMLYTYPNFWDSSLGDPTAFARYPLWMASYGVSRAPVADLWQYTSSAHVKGIEGAVDLSRFVGTSGFPWSTLSDGTVNTPWQAAAPAAPTSVKASLDGTTATVTWRPGDAGTSRIKSYRVVQTPGNVVKTVKGTHFAATFPDLAPGVAYSFTVAATNSVDRGPASAPTAALVPTVPTVLSVSVKPSLAYGDDLPLRTKLTRADTKTALAGKHIIVYRRGSSGRHWHKIRALHTDTDGKARTTLRPSHSAQLEAVFPGGKGVARSQAYKNYVVHPTVTAAVSPSSVVTGTEVTFTGAVRPHATRQVVIRQRRINGHWVDKGRTRVDDQGGFVDTITPKAAGDYVFRFRVKRADGRASGHSARVHLSVT